MDSSIYFCVPCAFDNAKISANVWCRECRETLCDSCNKQHKRVNVCKNHYTIAVDLLPSKEVLDSISLSNHCSEHTNSNAVLYCLDHDEPCCSKCLVQENEKHKKCKTVSIQDASENVKRSTILSCISNDMEDIQSTLSKLSYLNDLNIENIDSAGADVISKVTNFKQNIMAKLDEFENKVFKDLKLHQKEIKSKVLHQKEKATMVMNSVEKCSTELEFIKSHGSNEQILLHSFKVQKTVKTCTEALEDVLLQSKVYNLDLERFQHDLAVFAEPSVSISVSQSPSTIIHEARNLLQAQFVPVVSIQPRLDKFNHQNSFQLEGYFQRDIGIAVSEDEHIILFHRLAMRIVKYSITTGEQIASCHMKFLVSGVSVLPGKDAVIVSLSNKKKIYFVNLNTMDQQETIISLPEIIAGIHATSNKILAGSNFCLYLLSHSGQILSTFEATNAKWYAIRHVRLCENDTILYSDSKAVYTYSSDQQNKCIYKCTYTLASAIEGIETDKEGNLYILLPGTSEVITISSAESEPEQVFLGKKDGLSYPKAICFNKTYNTFLVVNNSGRHLSIFKNN
ncbi:uncharacterized protein LOC127730055 [Mytilus californianus]|uniref:uncharacterized protein LOC127730055 n=1 Tax=Mytilus californianus TaxID=6549 RepID=UPI0022485BA8|nr:uncharacterized protein LOC127730055 [Mytilus californianus]